MSRYGSDMYYIEDDDAIDMIEKAMEKVKTKVTPEMILAKLKELNTADNLKSIHIQTLDKDQSPQHHNSE